MFRLQLMGSNRISSNNVGGGEEIGVVAAEIGAIRIEIPQIGKNVLYRFAEFPKPLKVEKR